MRSFAQLRWNIKKRSLHRIRDSYSGFRKNLGEPWNAVNQLIQGRPGRAAKTLGRFTINTVTTLGFADPASRLGLETEDENFGTTLGYWGVPIWPIPQYFLFLGQVLSVMALAWLLMAMRAHKDTY